MESKRKGDYNFVDLKNLGETTMFGAQLENRKS